MSLRVNPEWERVAVQSDGCRDKETKPLATDCTDYRGLVFKKFV